MTPPISVSVQFDLRCNALIQAGTAGVEKVGSGFDKLPADGFHVDLQIASVNGEHGFRGRTGSQAVQPLKAALYHNLGKMSAVSDFLIIFSRGKTCLD